MINHEFLDKSNMRRIHAKVAKNGQRILRSAVEPPIKVSLQIVMKMTPSTRGVQWTLLLMSFLSAYSRSSSPEAFEIRTCALNNSSNLANGDMLCAYIITLIIDKNM